MRRWSSLAAAAPGVMDWWQRLTLGLRAARGRYQPGRRADPADRRDTPPPDLLSVSDPPYPVVGSGEGWGDPEGRGRCGERSKKKKGSSAKTCPLCFEAI